MLKLQEKEENCERSECKQIIIKLDSWDNFSVVFILLFWWMRGLYWNNYKVKKEDSPEKAEYIQLPMHVNAHFDTSSSGSNVRKRNEKGELKKFRSYIQYCSLQSALFKHRLTKEPPKMLSFNEIIYHTVVNKIVILLLHKVTI